MMKKILSFILVSCVLSLLTASAVTAGDEFISLCYHNTMDRVNDPEGMTISTKRLIEHFSWLKSHGFRAITVDDLLAAGKGERPLPDKAVLLTFDDGYDSFYQRVYPLLKAYEFPAVLALVGSWMEGPDDNYVRYGDHIVPREWFISWDEAKEMADSGLVEIASHSYELHLGVKGNPQENSQPALAHRIFDKKTGVYEGDVAFLNRIRKDLEKNTDLIQEKTGKRPRVMVWPYGKFNLPAVQIARDLGMPITLTLEDGANYSTDISKIRRYLVSGDQKLNDLVWQIHNIKKTGPYRVVHVDLDYVYDPDPVQQEKNLGLLIERIEKLKISAVFLQAYADADGNGTADALYFPNRHLPVKADLFNRVAWQLRNRAGVDVFAWMPVLGFEFGEESWLVQEWKKSDTYQTTDDTYRRLSPFEPKARKAIREIYADLARYADFQGLLFHDDAFFTDFEDNHPHALQTYREKWGLPGSIREIRNSPEAMKRWTEAKSQMLIDWTQELAGLVKIWRPTIFTARNIYAMPIMNPESEAWFAQSLPQFLNAYDWTAIMAMPYMEKAGAPLPWLGDMVAKVKKYPQGLKKTVFELQSYDWNREKPIPTAELVEQMKFLQRQGAVNFGYYPDNFLENHPERKKVHTGISLQIFPYQAGDER
ncbi:MAG: poly-beta-1,6-N-acetyl-D-glucosamine N-deacetylase PgaB [Deltaproteobacteria bacterium]|nr:poly-beta-1,6-N-acetyl-D-glucosamine N-deacetylase PgaB [Deltaproteobacteria bacterium]